MFLEQKNHGKLPGVLAKSLRLRASWKPFLDPDRTEQLVPVFVEKVRNIVGNLKKGKSFISFEDTITLTVLRKYQAKDAIWRIGKGCKSLIIYI